MNEGKYELNVTKKLLDKNRYLNYAEKFLRQKRNCQLSAKLRSFEVILFLAYFLNFSYILSHFLNFSTLCHTSSIPRAVLGGISTPLFQHIIFKFINITIGQLMQS